jgi:hypothetical protein
MNQTRFPFYFPFRCGFDESNPYNGFVLTGSSSCLASGTKSPPFQKLHNHLENFSNHSKKKNIHPENFLSVPKGQISTAKYKQPFQNLPSDSEN